MVIHIVPSGSDKTLCGLKGRKGTSLGLACECEDCLKIADNLIKKCEGELNESI